MPGRLWRRPGHPWRLLGRPWGYLAALGAALGGTWGDLGDLWGHLGVAGESPRGSPGPPRSPEGGAPGGRREPVCGKRGRSAAVAEAGGGVRGGNLPRNLARNCRSSKNAVHP